MIYAKPKTKTMWPIRQYQANNRTIIYRSDGAMLYKSPRTSHPEHYFIIDYVDSQEAADVKANDLLSHGHSCCKEWLDKAKGTLTCGCVFPPTITILDYDKGEFVASY